MAPSERKINWEWDTKPRWTWDRSLSKVVNVLSKEWWHTDGDAVLEWLESEGIEDWNVHHNEKGKPIIFLYTDEQISYFNLRWPQ